MVARHCGCVFVPSTPRRAFCHPPSQPDFARPSGELRLGRPLRGRRTEASGQTREVCLDEAAKPRSRTSVAAHFPEVRVRRNCVSQSSQSQKSFEGPSALKLARKMRRRNTCAALELDSSTSFAATLIPRGITWAARRTSTNDSTGTTRGQMAIRVSIDLGPSSWCSSSPMRAQPHVSSAT